MNGHSQLLNHKCLLRDWRLCRRLVRSILADKPRVTRFPVEFDPVEAAPTAETAAAPQDAFAAAAAPEAPAFEGLQPAVPAGYGGFGLGGEAAMDREAMEMEA